MELPRAQAADDPRLDDFTALNDPARRRELERRGDHFVVEGAVALEQLLRTGGWEVRQVVLAPRAAERLADLLGPVRDRTIVAEAPVLREVVGFDLHRGVLASVQRRPPRSIADLLHPTQPQLAVALEGVNDHENLGAIYRNAAGFGCAAVALDPTTADPFYRRSVRVSLGHVMTVPTATIAAAPAGIDELRAAGATVVALSPSGEVDLRVLSRSALGSGPLAVLAGAEGPGLSDRALAAADVRAAIAMPRDVDSLNVATAVAVALFHLSA
ncbi:MAG: RNA methyltransferase [Acidimicrobiales bacterium]|nr:RNA methyltransferase [Acidimicrobiales bacterium]HRW38626.1 RNA methyltransferase [Aquihabitans sp.]